MVNVYFKNAGSKPLDHILHFRLDVLLILS
jgi:hypothetical protein